MVGRIAHGLVTIGVCERWTPEWVTPPKRRVGSFVWRSARGEGRLVLEAIAMPSDMDPFTVERLRSMAERSHRGHRGGKEPQPFDEIAWTVDGVACVGRSVAFERTVALDWARVLEDLPQEIKAQRAELEKHTAPGPRIRRDWWLARGTHMANVWYESPVDDNVAKDLVDCEEMVRSLRFDARA
jgi:hypothetical protein